MTGNISQYTSAGIELAYWAANNSSGYPAGPTGTLANGSDASMSRLIGINGLNLNLQQPRQVNVPGDDDVQSVFFFKAEANPSGELTLGVFDATFASKGQGTLTYAEGDYDLWVGQPDSPTFNQMTLMTISQAQSKESGSSGEAQWYVKMYPKVQAVPLSDAGLSNAAATSFTHALIANKSSKHAWGQALSLTNNGTTEAAFVQFASPRRVLMHTHIGDGSDTTVTLAQTVYASNGTAVKLWQDGVLKTYTTHYTASGTTLTFASAPGAGVVSVCLYQY